MLTIPNQLAGDLYCHVKLNPGRSAEYISIDWDRGGTQQFKLPPFPAKKTPFPSLAAMAGYMVNSGTPPYIRKGTKLRFPRHSEVTVNNALFNRGRE